MQFRSATLMASLLAGACTVGGANGGQIRGVDPEVERAAEEASLEIQAISSVCIGSVLCTAFLHEGTVELRKRPDAKAEIDRLEKGPQTLTVHPADSYLRNREWVRVLETDDQRQHVILWAPRKRLEFLADFEREVSCWPLKSTKISFGDYEDVLTFRLHGTGDSAHDELKVVASRTGRVFVALSDGERQVSTIFVRTMESTDGRVEGELYALGMVEATYFDEATLAAEGCPIPEVVKVLGGTTKSYLQGANK